MDFMELATQRYSVRKFTEQRVEKQILDKILEAGHVAPTGCNYQPQRILVLNSDNAVEKLKKCTKYHFNSKTALLVCYDKTECWKRKYDGKTCGEVDASIVCTHMMLRAFELGVGSTWVMSFDPEATRREFNIPENIEPVSYLVMGYPAEDAKPMHLHSEYRPLEEVIVYDEF